MPRRFFTRDNPPMGGKAKRLWDWFIDQNRDTDDYPCFIPDALYINNPRKWSNPHGTCKYVLVYNGTEFMTDNVETVILNPLPNWKEWHLKDVVYLDYEIH